MIFYSICFTSDISFIAADRLKGYGCDSHKKEYFEFMKSLAAKFPDVDKIIIIQDNLNTHNASSFYENTSAEGAFKLMKNSKCVIHRRKQVGSIWQKQQILQFLLTFSSADNIVLCS